MPTLAMTARLLLVEQSLERCAGGIEAEGIGQGRRLDRKKLRLRNVEARCRRTNGCVVLVARPIEADQRVLAVVAAGQVDAHQRLVVGRGLRQSEVALESGQQTGSRTSPAASGADASEAGPSLRAGLHFCTWYSIDPSMRLNAILTRRSVVRRGDLVDGIDDGLAHRGSDRSMQEQPIQPLDQPVGIAGAKEGTPPATGFAFRWHCGRKAAGPIRTLGAMTATGTHCGEDC